MQRPASASTSKPSPGPSRREGEPIGDVTSLPGAKGGSDLSAIVDQLDAGWKVAGDIQCDIANAAGILEVFAYSPSQIVVGEDGAKAWLQVEYAARQIQRHAEDLGAELEKIERAAMALRRAIEASCSSSPTDGGAA